MKKMFVLFWVFMLSFVLVSCGEKDEQSLEDNNGQENNQSNAVGPQYEFVDIDDEDTPSLVDEFKIGKPEGLEFLDWEMDKEWNKTISYIYIWTLEKAESEAKKIAEGAWLTLDESFNLVQTRVGKEVPKMIVYSNFDPSLEVIEIRDGSKYMKSVTVEELIDGKISFGWKEYKWEAILWINIVELEPVSSN